METTEITPQALRASPPQGGLNTGDDKDLIRPLRGHLPPRGKAFGNEEVLRDGETETDRG